MFTTIITDCKGENEAGRQIARYASLGLGPANLVGIGSGLDDDATIETAGNLVDILDATEGKRGVIVANVAPRGNREDGENGTQFSYFYYGKTLVIAIVKGYTFSLVKKLGITDSVKLLETSEVLEHAVFAGLINAKQAAQINKSQFRSFDFVPRVAQWLLQGAILPSKPYPLSTVSDIPSCIWHIDSFGNAKTTLFAKDLSSLNFERTQSVEKTGSIHTGQVDNAHINTNFGVFNYYERLKDVPAGETAIYTGSSGIGSKRFIEIATQGVAGSAAATLKLKVGDVVEIM
jgi:hypothetical protein